MSETNGFGFHECNKSYTVKNQIFYFVYAKMWKITYCIPTAVSTENQLFPSNFALVLGCAMSLLCIILGAPGK